MNNESVLFLLKSIEQELPLYIEDVLNDSFEDPHHSAVHTTSLINCVVELLTELGEKLPFYDTESYFEHAGFSKEEYKLFEESRRKESVYYRGAQY